MVRVSLLLALLAAPVAAHAQEGDAGNPPERIRQVYLLKDEPCPKASTPNEVVVCAPADPEQYRIPKQLRAAPKGTPANTAWATRVDRVMEDNRKVLPGSCSPIGTGGQSGCAMQALQRWAAERQAAKNGYENP